MFDRRHAALVCLAMQPIQVRFRAEGQSDELLPHDASTIVRVLAYADARLLHVLGAFLFVRRTLAVHHLGQGEEHRKTNEDADQEVVINRVIIAQVWAIY